MTSQEQHVDVGAYVLGVLDNAEAARFEAHLAVCAFCSAEFDALVGLEPVLAEFARSAPDVQTLAPRPSGGLLTRLVGEVSSSRRAAKSRRLYLVAAAAALIIAGPVVAAVVASSGSGSAQAGGVTGTIHTAKDSATHVSAKLGTEDKKWGTDVDLELKNVSGPLECDLVAVSKNGQEQVVTTWMVPKKGYGVPGQPDPLVIQGGSALPSSQIDHFEVRTLEGKHLVSVPV